MAFVDTWERSSQGPETGWVDWVTLASTSDHACSFLAVDPTGTIVGLVGSAWKDDVTWIGSMWVDPSLRRGGVGGRLLEAILTWAEKVHPTSEVRLGVVPTQEAAVRLYRKWGFVDTGKVSPLEHTPGAVWHEMARPAWTARRDEGRV